MKRLLVILTVGFFTQILGYTLSAQTLFFTGTTDGEVIESITLCELDEKAETLKALNKFKGGQRPGYLAIGREVLYINSRPWYR